MNSSDIIYETRIYKQSLYLKKFRSRWMALKGNCLYFYKAKSKQKYTNPTEIIDLTIYDKIQQSSNWINYDISFTFELISTRQKKRRILIADFHDEMIQWMGYINNIQTQAMHLNTINGWKQLATVPFTKYFQPIPLKSNQILIFPFIGSTFYKYNINNNNNLSKAINYPAKLWLDNHSIVSMDKQNNVLYVVCAELGVFTLNIKSMEWNEYLEDIACMDLTWPDINKCIGIAIDNILHIIGDSKHSLWMNNKMVYFNILPFIYDASNMHLFYVKKKQILLLVDGSIMYEYYVSKNQWKELTVQLPIKLSVQSILINDEYLITFDNVGIQIIDMNGFTVRKSNISCPMKQIKFVCLVEDDSETVHLIINGFSKRFCNNNDLRYLSNDVIRIVQSYYQMQSIHAFSTEIINNHWRISVDQLLSDFPQFT